MSQTAQSTTGTEPKKRSVKPLRKKKFDEVYCGNWKCENQKCLRHHVHQPWDEAFRQLRWEPDEKGGCAGYFEGGL